MGPDNLWMDAITEKMIAFELKTDKKSTSLLNKEDIGQGLNHIEWLKKNYPRVDLVGLIFLTDSSLVSEKANPSDNMYIGSQSALRKMLDDFLSSIERLRPKTQLER